MEFVVETGERLGLECLAGARCKFSFDSDMYLSAVSYSLAQKCRNVEARMVRSVNSLQNTEHRI
jgi:hypothetical protein